MVPGVRVSVNELRPTTRFNDLHEDLQKAIEFVDNFILQQIDLQGQCAVYTDHIDQMCQQMPPDVDYCTKTLNTMQQALENDAESIAFARGLVKSDAADAKLSFKAIQNLRMPQPSHQSGLWNASAVSQSLGPFFPEDDVDDGATRNIVDFFSKQADDMSKILHTYNRNITEVETYLKGVESNTMQQMEQITSSRGRDGVQRNAGDQVRELAHVLREFGHAIENVAANVSSTRDIVQEVTS